MRKNVFVFGTIAGIIVSGILAVAIAYGRSNPDFEGGMLVGYAAMLLAFTFIFVGIKNYRDKYCNGIIKFGPAFKTGFYIALIASTIYVIAWLFEFYLVIPDYMDVYSAHELKKLKESGASAAEITAQTNQVTTMSELYKNPLFVVLFTYLEILPVGLLVTLVCALILKRKVKPGVV